MNTTDTHPTAPADEPTLAVKPGKQSERPGKASKTKHVEYKLKISAPENDKLIALRDSFRSAGLRVTKAKLLRAAVTLLNQQSSRKIEEHLKELVPLKSESKKKRQ